MIWSVTKPYQTKYRNGYFNKEQCTYSSSNLLLGDCEFELLHLNGEVYEGFVELEPLGARHPGEVGLHRDRAQQVLHPLHTGVAPSYFGLELDIAHLQSVQ